MFVVTADQLDSSRSPDLVPAALEALRSSGAEWRLPPERTAGDEVQGVPADATSALRAVLCLHRLGRWRIGLGVGTAEKPLPGSTRAARGPAFLAARRAVERAGRRGAGRFALEAGDASDEPAARGAQALVGLLLDLREGRSERGWQAYELALAGLDAQAAARRLGVTPGAYRQRLSAARVKLEQDALEPVAAALAAADGADGGRLRRAPGSERGAP